LIYSDGKDTDITPARLQLHAIF